MIQIFGTKSVTMGNMAYPVLYRGVYGNAVNGLELAERRHVKDL